MTMNSLEALIERCRQRHEKPLRQRRTVVTPALYNKSYSYQVTVYCAQRYPVLLADMEQANISFMPIGRAPEYDRGPRDFDGERFLKRQGRRNWGIRRWHASWGLQVYTGVPSASDGARWHDINFKYEAICAAPDEVLACIEALVNAVANPLLTMSRSGGLRFSCRVLDYLHPNTEQEKLYIHKHTPTSEIPDQRDVYLEIIGEEGYSRWDARYEILLGNLLDPPIIAKEVLFAPIDALRAELHEPIPLEDASLISVTENEALEKNTASAPESLGSHNLNLAKVLFLKHGFSYVQQEDGYHYWVSPDDTAGNAYVSLWKSNGIVWVRASSPNAGLPTTPTSITDIWNDTGILQPIPAIGLSVSDEMNAVRAGKLSPLAIKRPPPVLQKSERSNTVDAPFETQIAQVARSLDGTSHILGLVTQREKKKNYGIESHVRNGGAACLNLPNVKLVAEAEQHFREQNLPSEKIQISAIYQLFFDPQHSKIVKEMLEKGDDAEQLCIVSKTKAYKLFPECRISKNVLEEWSLNWKGSALGNFAKTLLHAVEIEDKPHADSVKRIRTAVQVFEWQEEVLVKQMREANVEGKEPHWTYWHQLKRFFTYYMRDADAPIRWNNEVLRFWIPPVLHPSVKRLLLTSLTLPEEYLRRALPDKKITVNRTEPAAWRAGNQVFQIRTGVYPRHTILNYNGNQDITGISKTGQRFFAGIRAEIERDPSIKHAIITYKSIAVRLEDIAEKENVCFVTDFKNLNGLNTAFREAQVVWIVGTPQWNPNLVWRSAQILFGNDEEPLSYEEEETDTLRYKDERIQGIYEQAVARVLTRLILRVRLNHWRNKKVVLISSLALPNITDRPETLLFDWEDFEVAGGLNKLPEAIATRQHFETERDNLTAESSREKVEQVLGCSSRQANRVLQRLRGGRTLRVPFRQQILTLLSADGEKRTAEFVAAIEGHPKAIKNELKRLVDAGEIIKVRWGVYTLPQA